jgi:hypothetical protein
MICSACKNKMHVRCLNGIVYEEINDVKRPVPQEGTRCDCQHRSTLEEKLHDNQA